MYCLIILLWKLLFCGWVSLLILFIDFVSLFLGMYLKIICLRFGIFVLLFSNNVYVCVSNNVVWLRFFSVLSFFFCLVFFVLWIMFRISILSILMVLFNVVIFCVLMNVVSIVSFFCCGIWVIYFIDVMLV